MPFPTDPNAPRPAHFKGARNYSPSIDHTGQVLIQGRYYDVDKLDEPDPYDVEALADVERAIADAVDHFTGEEWPNLRNEATAILNDWLRS